MSQTHFAPSQNGNGDKNCQMANPNEPLVAYWDIMNKRVICEIHIPSKLNSN